MSDLKPGDTVKCVDPGNYLLTRGKQYVADRVSPADFGRGQWVTVVADDDAFSTVLGHRFMKVEPAPPSDRGYAVGLADAVAWLRRDGVPTTAARLRQAVDDGHFTSPPPVPVLPTEPGYYLAPDAFPSPLVVELLNSPAGQWVDIGDRTYLETANVAKLGRLDRLERRADTATRLLQRRLDLGGHRDEVIDERVAREFGVDL